MLRKSLRPAIVVSIVALLAGGIYFANRSGNNPQVYSNDFNVYYFAAQEVIDGRDPYQNSLGAWTPYLYLPLLAESMVALAWLPLPVAAYFWFLISAASMIAAAWMSAGLVAGFGNDERGTVNDECGTPCSSFIVHHSSFKTDRRLVIAISAFAVVIRFAFDNFAYGQVNTLVAWFVVVHLYMFAKDRKTLSSFALALAASIKLTPAVFVAYHFAKRKFKFAVSCAALFVAMTLLSFLPFGASGTSAFETFVNRTIKNEQGFDLAHSGNQSLRGAIARLAGESDDAARRPSNAITVIISIILLALSVLTAIIARNAVAGAAPFFCCLVLLSPLSWKAHFVVLILPIAYLISQMFEASGRRRYMIAAVLLLAFFLFNFTSPRVIGAHASDWTDAHSMVFVGALLIYFACLWTALSRTPGSGTVWQPGRHVC